MPKKYMLLEKKVELSELAAGKSPKEARRIGFATATARLGAPKHHR